MKNLFYIFLFLPFFLQAQENCQGSYTEYYLNSNNIRASFFPRGNKFTDGSNGAFLAPYPSGGGLSTIFASSPWLAGLDGTGNLRLAAETYPTPNDFDFAVGPLNFIGVPYYDACAYFDKAWSVFSEDILKHMEDYNQDFKIDDTIPSVFGWPGRGNKYFSRFNGFELPGNDVLGLADFRDTNGNNVYDPDAGDYPALDFLSQFIIPDQMMWMVFNDVDTLNPSGNSPIRAEFQLTAFAFHCEDKAWLNNTIFNKYKIIYRGLTSLDSTFFGFWTDYDLGCSEDDFMGSDSIRDTEFVYNADAVDGNASHDCTTGSATYANHPPVQSMTWLSHPMHSFFADNRMVQMSTDVYQNLKGLWGDGTPIRPNGNGHNQDTSLRTTKFLYHGDPRDTNSWAAINVLEEGMDTRSVSSISLGRINPGFFTYVYTAHMFHADPDADHLGQITHMFNNVDSLLAMSWLPHEPICIPVQTCLDDDCVWPGDFDKNGIADHRDYLMWGVFNGGSGPGRDGLISWRGHPGENWSEEFVGINPKHGDADGNGVINDGDINVHSQNLFLTNRFYVGEVQYPKGSDIVITADPFMDAQGSVKRLNVKANRPIDNLLGLTFELEFDTTLFEIRPLNSHQNDTTRLYFNEQYNPHGYKKFAFTKRDHLPISMDSATQFFMAIPSNGLRLKSGLPIPDSTILRLRNLKAIDPGGNDLLLGSEPIVIYREGFVSTQVPSSSKSSVYPNPTDGHICIDIEMETEAELFSIQGHKLRHFNKHDVNRLIDVSEIPPGMYILRIIETGESIKLVIQ